METKAFQKLQHFASRGTLGEMIYHVKLNKMNRILIIFSLLILNSCAPKRLKKTVELSYSNVIFKPTELSKKVNSNLTLNIEPIDAKKLNNEIFEASRLDGSYEKTLIQSYIYQEEVKQSLSLEERRKLGIATSIDNFLNKAANDNIPESVIINFKEKVLNTYLLGKSYGFNGSEVNYFRGNERYKILNPYNNNNKYLSLFKLTFKNSGNAIEEIESKNFQILNNNELLYPFKNLYFEDNLKGQESLKFIYRMNLPDNLRIVSGQTVVKYISIPALNTEYKNLIVNYIVKDKTIDFPYDITAETKNEVENFLEFQITQSEYTGNYRYYYVIKTDDAIFPLDGKSFFINEKNISQPISIYKLTIDLHKNQHSIFKNTFIPSEFKDGKIKLKKD